MVTATAAPGKHAAIARCDNAPPSRGVISLRMVLRGEPQPKGDDWRRATVGAAAVHDSHWRIWCEDCRHHLVVSAEDLIELHGVEPATSFWHLGQRLTCSACGSHRTGIMAASWRRSRDSPSM